MAKTCGEKCLVFLQHHCVFAHGRRSRTLDWIQCDHDARIIMAGFETGA